MRARKLARLNVGAGFLHLANFVAAVVLTAVYGHKSVRGTLTTDFTGTQTILGTYTLLWVDVPFSLITGIFHLFLAFGAESTTHYKSYVFVKGYNPYRWIEYAITASFMTWVILQVSGVTNILTLLVVGVGCNVALQAQGYFMDILNGNWVPTWVGWVVFSFQWTLIWTYFAYQAPGAPWIVYSVVIGMFIQYCLFGLVQILQYTRVWPDPYQIELAYIGLSYTSKFYLNWNLIIYMLTQ